MSEVRSVEDCFGVLTELGSAELRAEYRRRLWRALKFTRDPNVLFVYVLKCAIHYHHYTIAMGMTEGTTAVVNSF